MWISRISPVLFAIYTTEVHSAVERDAEGSRCIFFIDYVTRVVEGDKINDFFRSLEGCARGSLV